MAKTVGKLKKDLWIVFTLYIKLSNSKDGQTCKCFTCGAPIKIGSIKCHGGHWLPKGGYPVHYFNEDNVKPQCFRCNMHLEGNSAVFEQNLRALIGDDKVNHMYDTRHALLKRDRLWYHEMLDHYKAEVKRLRESF